MGIFGGSSPPPPPVPPAPPIPEIDDGSAALKAEEEKRRIRKMKGRKSTILTSAQGVEGEARVRGKTLLGE